MSGRKPLIPGVEVTEWYDNGQAKKYSYKGRELTRVEYNKLVAVLQKRGDLPGRVERPDLRRADNG